jgi:hypothetical protein
MEAEVEAAAYERVWRLREAAAAGTAMPLRATDGSRERRASRVSGDEAAMAEEGGTALLTARCTFRSIVEVMAEEMAKAE